MEIQEEANRVTSSMDARERRKLQNRVAQRNFRRRQALKQQRSEQQEREIPVRPQSSEIHVDDSCHLAGQPEEIQPSCQTSNLQDDTWTTTEYPEVSTLTSHDVDIQSPGHLPTGPLSPVSFPLFCSPEDLISDNQGEHIPVNVSDTDPNTLPADLPPISFQITPQSTDPLSQHSPVGSVKPLAASSVRRAARNGLPSTRKRSITTEYDDQFQTGGMRRVSPPHHPPSPMDQSLPWDGVSKSAEGKTTLHLCAEKGHATVLRFLLTYGAEIDATDVVGRTALHYAAMKGHTDLISVLLEQGADTELPDEFGLTPLHIAVELGHETVVKILVSEGADPNARIGCSTRIR